MTAPRPTSSFDHLTQYATTDHQREIIEAVIAHGGRQADAARALGLKREHVTSAITKLRTKAALQGHAPEHGWQGDDLRTEPIGTVPATHRVKGVSDKLGPDGKRIEAWVKSDLASTNDRTAPPGHLVKKTARLTDSTGQTRAFWESTEAGKVQAWDALTAACESFVARYVPPAAPIPLGPTVGASPDNLNIFPLGDPHIGMLSWAPETGHHFDLKIASNNLRLVIDALVAEAPPADEALLMNVGDFFHADDDSQRTAHSGNKLDVEGRSQKVFDLGVELMVWMISRLLERHRIVRVVNLPGNHDPQASRFLVATLKAWFRNEPRVTIEPNLNPYWYYRFGATLFGGTHGEGPKPAELPEIMASDRSSDWGETEFHVWLTGHVHHDQVKDYRSCTVWTFRTIAPGDYWHHWKGYRSRRSLQRLTFHKTQGLVGSGVRDLFNLIGAQ